MSERPGLEGPVPVLRSKWPGAPADAATRIVCGVFRLDHGASSSLLSLLPSLLVHQSASAPPSHAAWVHATVTMLDAELQRAADGTVWVAECDNWYKNEHGVLTNNWPAFTVSYWRRMRDFRPHEFVRRAAT